MDQLIVEFMIGILGGTAFGLFASRGSGRRSRPKANSRRRAQTKAASTTGRTSYQRKTRPISPTATDLAIAAEKNRNATISVADSVPMNRSVPKAPSIVGPVHQAEPVNGGISFAKCPSCGLEASHVLISEHYVSSPSHKFGNKTQPEDLGEVNSDHRESLNLEETHHSKVVRNILAMLVPPRAFGRRHLDRGEEVFPGLVPKPGRLARTFPGTAIPLRMDN